MAAITGQYKPARRVYWDWINDWRNDGNERWTSPRFHLAAQLNKIRKENGSHEAIEFRNYLKWLGCYPVRKFIFFVDNNHPGFLYMGTEVHMHITVRNGGYPEAMQTYNPQKVVFKGNKSYYQMKVDGAVEEWEIIYL